MRVDIAWLPPERAPLDATCVVIDVLRATSTVAVLMGRGLRGVYPAATIDAARALRGRLGDGVLLCGERNALPPEGFDFGNSPVEFARASLDRWHEAVMATTNGTPALLACAPAPLVLAAAPLNDAATIGACLDAGRDVLVVCSGRQRQRATDDSLAAALLARRLVERGVVPEANAREGLALLDSAGGNLGRAFRMTEHGRALLDLNFDADLDFCGEENRYGVAAALHLEGGLHVLRPLDTGATPAA
jgi:2-phosphosulfolactate phosphatase